MSLKHAKRLQTPPPDDFVIDWDLASSVQSHIDPSGTNTGSTAGTAIDDLSLSFFGDVDDSMIPCDGDFNLTDTEKFDVFADVLADD
eukprot:CAMPEP_0172486800 /NCGR_PEP_ID=MMETSP1066-20121228/15533_1 /TAXON_ID=671091 /ORGANISM="Coscinodiscus wailesii, Strain CCMP2513" /LENGTH=86 /DNA_ID=CAMNT_0013252985 /DNA_START=12 /DNA_END=269 /DNA_ORIENTATION=-